jgi:hypothetical protein
MTEYKPKIKGKQRFSRRRPRNAGPAKKEFVTKASRAIDPHLQHMKCKIHSKTPEICGSLVKPHTERVQGRT